MAIQPDETTKKYIRQQNQRRRRKAKTGGKRKLVFEDEMGVPQRAAKRDREWEARNFG